MMKSKSPLTLMELLVMVLVFALAVGLCVRIFVVSDLMSRDAERKDQAMFLVQNAAETVKQFRGDMDMVQKTLGGELSGERLTVYYDEEWNRSDETGAVYNVTIERVDSSQAFLGSAEVTASMGEETLFEITIAFQEVNGHE